LVKEALANKITIREAALEKARSGDLHHIQDDRPVKPEEIDGALSDLRKLTEGGVVG
jgi:hypothetical protein